MDGVFWIKGDPPASLAIVLCPLGEDGLETKLQAMKDAGIEVLVSLLEPDEATWLGLAEEGPLAAKVGIDFLSFPIRDTRVPNDSNTFRAFAASLADRLHAGQRIALHCRGSIGRAPLTAACTLIHLGWTAHQALEAIEAARGCSIPDTREQFRWIRQYEAKP